MTRAALDFKTASRSSSTIAAFTNRYTDDLGHETFHCQAHAAVFAGQGCQRAASAADDDRAVTLYLSQRSQLVVHQLGLLVTASWKRYASATYRFASRRSATKNVPPSWPAVMRSSRESLASAWRRRIAGGRHLLNGLDDAKLDGQAVLALTGLPYHDLVGTQTQQDVELDKSSPTSPSRTSV